mgnify:CR=1 FL=1
MKPYVIVFSTTTLDGKIASKTRYSKLSCPIDFMRLHNLRSKVDAIMIGAKTAIIDDPSLCVKYFKCPHNPMRIVVDGSLKVPLELRMFNDGIAKTIVLTSTKAPKSKVMMLRNLGVEVLVYESENTKINLAKALRDIYYQFNVKKLLVEGGGELIWSLIQEKLVDEFRITKTSYVFGGLGVSVVAGEGYNTTKDSPLFILRHVELCACGREVHLIYEVKYK